VLKLRDEYLNLEEKNMPTPHNEALANDFAKTVLMPGDPLRAKYIAENFLTDVKQVNGVRNMFGYTGYYNGKKVSVMGSGMGIPSISLYAYELYTVYHVDRIIRIGSSGATTPDLKLFDIVIAMGACTNSSWANQYKLPGTFSAVASYPVMKESIDACEKYGFPYQVGNTLSSDNFYGEEWEPWAEMGVIAIEMEAYGLYCVAAQLHKEALTILTISDSLITHAETTPHERETGFNNMIKVALDCIKE
jgi:purine-nucleoside phosphorylase